MALYNKVKYDSNYVADEFHLEVKLLLWMYVYVHIKYTSISLFKDVYPFVWLQTTNAYIQRLWLFFNVNVAEYKLIKIKQSWGLMWVIRVFQFTGTDM